MRYRPHTGSRGLPASSSGHASIRSARAIGCGETAASGADGGIPRIQSRIPQSLIPNLQLVIAGKKGWLTEAIERRAAELGAAEQVCFAGYVDDDDLPALLSGALGFVFPSLYEGFGMPVLEAMA